MVAVSSKPESWLCGSSKDSGERRFRDKSEICGNCLPVIADNVTDLALAPNGRVSTSQSLLSFVTRGREPLVPRNVVEAAHFPLPLCTGHVSSLSIIQALRQFGST